MTPKIASELRDSILSSDSRHDLKDGGKLRPHEVFRDNIYSSGNCIF